MFLPFLDKTGTWEIPFSFISSNTCLIESSVSRNITGDIAFIKLGYGSVSEAIRAQVPIIGIDFPQTAETRQIKKVVEDLGIGVCITSEEFYQGKWRDKISDVMELKKNFSHFPERFVKKGESQIAGIILDLLDEIC